MLLKDKVAVITGGTSGIGRATAAIFVQEGAQVFLSGRRRDLGEEISAGLGSRARFVHADVAREDDIVALVAHVVESAGRIDCLFNNAGFGGRYTPIAETSADAFDAVLAVNLRGPLLGMKHVAPIMVNQRSGSIISTASLGGHRAGYTGHDYSAAKAALIHLTRTVAAELGESGVRVNSISPGPTVTEIFTRHLAADARSEAFKRLRERFSTMQPLPRAGEAEDVAKVALFLASDLASFVSGQDVVVDGASVGGFGWSELGRERARLAQLLTA
jgi:NAD(P)-dependent dehydrogenase (short-subunit alcohol dehydrogenase family)